MTPLEQLHADQHDDIVLTSDHVLRAYLASCDPAVVAGDLAAHATTLEQRMLTAPIEGDPS